MNNTKKSWIGINTILHRNSKSRWSDIFLNSNGKLFTDQKTINEMFNSYYINVAGNLEKKIPKPKTKFQDSHRDMRDPKHVNQAGFDTFVWNIQTAVFGESFCPSRRGR